MTWSYRYEIHDALRDLCIARGPKSYLEIGTAQGRSLEVVLEHGKPQAIALCDIWDGQSWINGPHALYKNHDHIDALLRKRDYGGTVRFLDGSSHDRLPELIEAGDQFDLILVDGDHSDNGAQQDLMDAWQLLAVGGHLVFDDIYHTGAHGKPAGPWLLPLFEGFVWTLGSACAFTVRSAKCDGAGIIKRMR